MRDDICVCDRFFRCLTSLQTVWFYSQAESGESHKIQAYAQRLSEEEVAADAKSKSTSASADSNVVEEKVSL